MAESNARRLTVTAPDGVEIVGSVTGQGPALTLVYGAMMEQVGWAKLLPHLAAQHTVYTYDRRGRGLSGDLPEHSPAAEFADLRTFVESIPEPRDLFAHSSGSLVALGALEAGLQVRRLVLYEPPLATERPEMKLDLAERMDALLAKGDRDGALTLFFGEGMEQLAEDIQRLREGPRWEDQLRYVHTGSYDVRVTRTFSLRPEALARLGVPTLLLYGTESPDWMKRGVEKFHEAIPGSVIEPLEGQGHNAQFTNPEVLAAAINRFLA